MQEKNSTDENDYFGQNSSTKFTSQNVKIDMDRLQNLSGSSSEFLSHTDCMICHHIGEGLSRTEYLISHRQPHITTIIHCPEMCSTWARFVKRNQLMRSNQFFFRKLSDPFPSDIDIVIPRSNGSSVIASICYGIPARWTNTHNEIVVMCDWFEIINSETTGRAKGETIGRANSRKTQMLKSLSFKELLQNNPDLKGYWRKFGKILFQLEDENEFATEFPEMFQKIQAYIDSILR